MNKYLGAGQPIRVRFFNIVFSCGFFAGIMGVCACLMLGSSPFAIKIAAIFTLFFPAMFFFANYFNNHHDQITILTFILLNFIILPAMYLTGGGVDCGIPSYFALSIALAMFLVKGRTGIVLTYLTSIWCILIIAFSYYYPDYVIPLPTETSKFMAISSNAAMVAFAIGLMAKGVFIQYHKEKDSVNKLTEKLEDMSFKDPLTTTYNRRFMLEYLQSQMKKAWEKGNELSIVMIDIDKFKRLNDNYGHLVGDEVLINLSSILKSMCRDDDIVSRYGGEEFLMILPNVDKQTAAKRADELRKKVETSSLSTEFSETVTISLGVGSYHCGMSCVKFIEEADQNLYKAKESGRNRVCAE
ncbi:MAG: GGDEF domain-containing protein [Clostridia bacterium]|nr:GGDEF domain-containing protein [Clostridia bacterium]